MSSLYGAMYLLGFPAMEGKKTLIQPLNHVRAPDPVVPPRLHMEFQKRSSGWSPAFPYSHTSLSRRGSKASHQRSAKSCRHRCFISASAFVRSSCQSPAEPSMMTDGKPHL